MGEGVVVVIVVEVVVVMVVVVIVVVVVIIIVIQFNLIQFSGHLLMCRLSRQVPFIKQAQRHKYNNSNSNSNNNNVTKFLFIARRSFTIKPPCRK